MVKRKITKRHCFSKYLFQCILVLLEFGGVSFLFACIPFQVMDIISTSVILDEDELPAATVPKK